jgi:ribosomal protein S18 acetylase RimI-like enzyme
MSTHNMVLEREKTTSPEIRIREGSADDAEFFLAVEEQTTWESLPPDKRDLPRETLRERLLETHGLLLSCAGNVFFIAEVGGERAGLLWFGPRHNAITGEHEGWIYNVTVLEGFRGLGIAKKLLLHAENYAREQGYEVIGLSVAVHNEIARELYRRCEYSESNILMRKVLS